MQLNVPIKFTLIIFVYNSKECGPSLFNTLLVFQITAQFTDRDIGLLYREILL